jgi:hypothetical protein
MLFFLENFALCARTREPGADLLISYGPGTLRMKEGNACSGRVLLEPDRWLTRDGDMTQVATRDGALTASTHKPRPLCGNHDETVQPMCKKYIVSFGSIRAGRGGNRFQ